MKAGRELDALIAEKVMGWKRGDIYWHPYQFANPVDLTDTPKYSTSIADAWLVVEKMDQWSFDVSRHHQESEKGKRRGIWYQARVMIFGKVNWERDCWKGAFDSVGETAPHAICLAALKAVDNS